MSQSRDASDRRRVLWVSTIGAFLSPFIASAVNVALPPIGAEFGLDAVLLGWVPTAYLLAASICLLPVGRLADIYGRRRLFLVGVVLYTAFALLAAVAPSGELLIGCRAFQGLGGAIMFGTGPAIVMSVFPRETRGRALGWTVAAVYLGLSAGPSLGGALTEHLGWRSIFLVTVPPGLAMFLLMAWGVRGEWAPARGARFDAVGTALYTGGLGAVVLGFGLLPAPLGGLLLVVGLAGLGLFVAWELRTPSPVLELRLFWKNTVFALTSLAGLIAYAATFSVTFLLSLYLQYLQGFSPRDTGLVLLAQPVVMAAVSPIAGRLSDRVEPRVLASAGMTLTALGLLALGFLDRQTPPVYVLASLVLLGLGFALFSSPNINAAMSAVPPAYYGIASGITGTMRWTGQMLSMGITLLILALLVGRVELSAAEPGALLTALRVAFVVFGALCGGGVLASLRRGTIHAPAPSTARPRPRVD